MIEAIAKWPILEIFVGAGWLLISIQTWVGYKDDANQPVEGVDERTLGASVIVGQLSAVMTAASVILAGAGAFVALDTAGVGYPENYHLFYAALWAVLSLGIALFTMGLLPANAPNKNFVRLQGVAHLCSMALFVCFVSGARFLLAVGTILLSSGIAETPPPSA